MNTHADKTQENKSQSVANAVSKKKSVSESNFQFIDNRPEAIAQRKLQKMANDSPRVSQLRALQKMDNLNTDSVDVTQLAHKTIEAPSRFELEMMTIWNDAAKYLIGVLKYEKKGVHGTNYKHAISMMRDGIKINIPDEQRTSDVTARGHLGFYVDTSESENAHAPEFAEMAAYGTPNIPSDQEWTENARKAQEDYDKALEQFEEHKKAFEGTSRAVILEIWGPQDLRPETNDPEREEAIYKEGAEKMLVTIKEFM